MRRNAILLLVALLFVAACGARLSDEQRAALETTDAGSSGQQSGLGVVGDGGEGTTTTTAANGTSTSTTAVSSGGGDGSGGGSDGATGGDGGEAGGNTASGDIIVIIGGSPCGGGGSSEVGVTADEIKIGNVSTLTGPIPEFGRTGLNGVKAYLAFVNANGGVCGRQLSLVSADDRLQSGTNKAETDKLKDQVLGFVGATTVVDDGAAQSLQGTNIAYTGLTISNSMISSENAFSTTPLDLSDGGNNALTLFKYMKEVEGASRAALVWPAQASAKARIDGYRKDLERAGIEVVLNTEVAVTETNYAGVAANIEKAKADILATTLEITGMSNLARDLQTVGYFPKVPMYGAQAYGRDFLSRAGEAAEPTVLGLTFSMLEDRGSIPMVDAFVTWYERTNPGADIDFFAIQSWVAADMFVRALAGIDGPPTRDKLFAQLETFTEYDAGGFIAPINPAGNVGAKCFLIAKVRDGKWYRDHPDQPGFDCSYA